MQKRRLARNLLLVLLAVVFCFSAGPKATSIAFAETTSSSTNYQVTQTDFSSGSTLNSCSGTYCAQASVGDSAVGDAASANQTAQFGPVTNSQPLLEVIVNAGTSNLGVLSTTTTATKTTTVKVRNYLSGGYIMQIVGTPPTYDGHSLATNSTPTASTPGTEQFGINAAANTTPNVGAAAVQVPDSTTSFGVVSDNYKTPNLFMFNSGDVIATSPKQSGETDYTISMIVNISSGTPAGHYSTDFSAVVIPSY
jgi:hypothetical protein